MSQASSHQSYKSFLTDDNSAVMLPLSTTPPVRSFANGMECWMFSAATLLVPWFDSTGAAAFSGIDGSHAQSGQRCHLHSRPG
uniref:Uncharacterized protein n=1 Tax=Ditylenchus dipsaci TaxID=166011 RepID=A0A915EBI2_9BILA